MPLTPSGKKILASMTKEYGAKKAKQVFYASINAGKIPKDKVEGKSRKKHGRK